MNDLLKHIKEYFNTFSPKDYTIYVDGEPTEWCNVSTNNDRVVWDEYRQIVMNALGFGSRFVI